VKFLPGTVARIAIDAHQRGQRMSHAVAGHYHVTNRQAHDAILRARKAGWPIPQDPTGGIGRAGLNHCAQLAHVANQAHQRGERIVTAVQAAFGYPNTRAAITAISHARRQGFAIPYSKHARRDQPAGRPRPPLPPGPQLVCDCGCRFALDATALARHTWNTHHRPPTRTERTPRHTEAAA
jgi:hypothetical protein